MQKSWPGPLAAVLILCARSEFASVQGEGADFVQSRTGRMREVNHLPLPALSSVTTILELSQQGVLKTCGRSRSRSAHMLQAR
jgi:hypothetical protein